MRIAVVSNGYPKPGTNSSAFVQARVELYRRMGHDVDVYARGLEAMEHARARFDERCGRYDVVAVHIPNPDYTMPIVTPHLDHRPVVAYVHGAEGIRTPLYWSSIVGSVWKRKVKPGVLRFLNACDAVVTESEWMRREVRAYFGRDFRRDGGGRCANFRVIPNPVDPELFKLNGARGSRRGVCIRGSHRKYGVDLLDGLFGVDVLDPSFPRGELPGVLAKYGFFVAPSRIEGQGLMACEAAATGMPIVTTNVGAIPEFVFGHPHMLVEPSRRELATAIGAMWARLPIDEDLAGGIRDRVLGVCGPAATVDRDIALFEEVAR